MEKINIMKEIVIAAYDKPTDWLNKINNNVKKTIYRKGNVLPLQNSEILIEPNFGRCVHTFFNHILTNYDNLSEYTFFAQDYPFDHWEDLIDVVNGDVNTADEKAALKIDGYLEEGCVFADIDVAKYFSHESMIPEIQGIKPFAFHNYLGTNNQYKNLM